MKICFHNIAIYISQLYLQQDCVVFKYTQHLKGNNFFLINIKTIKRKLISKVFFNLRKLYMLILCN